MEIGLRLYDVLRRTDASVAQPGRSLGTRERPPRKSIEKAAGRGFKPRPRLHEYRIIFTPIRNIDLYVYLYVGQTIVGSDYCDFG